MAIPYSSYNYDNLSALTRDLYVPKLVDNIFKSNILTHRLLRKSVPFSGGKKVLQPIEYAKATQKGFYSGSDQLGTVGSTDTFADAAYDWVQGYATIQITGKEEHLNAGSERVIDLIEAKMKNAEKSMKELFGTQLYSNNEGDGTNPTTGLTSGADLDGFVGLQHIVKADRELGSINSNTSGNEFWDGGSIKDAGTSVTFDNMTTAGDAAYMPTLMRELWGDITIDADRPTLMVVSQVAFDAYEETLTGQKRFGASDQALADAGFSNLLYRGMPVVVDQQLESADGTSAYMLNENYIGFRHHSKRNFAFEDFLKPVDYDYAVAKILWMGALTCSAPRMQGRVYNLATSYS